MNVEALQQLRRVIENDRDDLFHMRALIEDSLRQLMAWKKELFGHPPKPTYYFWLGGDYNF